MTRKKQKEEDFSDNPLAMAYRQQAKEVIFPMMRKRLENHKAMLMSDKYAAIEVERCRRDIFRFFDYHLFTHEPRGLYLKWYGMKSALLPFILYPHQREVVKEICESIESGQDILGDKSREQGATWISVTILLWYWLKPESGNDFLLGSRKFENVDKKGASDTLFEKFRYNLYNLHPAFLPEGFNRDKHDNVGFIVNPATGNFIRGEANNPNFGTSGRYKAILADEFSKWDESDEAAFTSMGSSTLSRILISTPYGMGKMFSRLRFSGAIKVFQMHWTDHPLHGHGKYRVEQHPFLPDKKNVWVSPWYLRECERRKANPEADIGQELDMDHLSSGQPYFRNQMLYIQEQYKKLVENPPEVTTYEFERTGDDEIELYPSGTGRMYVLEDPIDGWEYRYSISCDVSEGLEHGDNSVFYIYDRVKEYDVAWFVGRIDTHILAILLRHYGFYYNEAYIAIEANNHGHHVIQEIKKSYDNLYHKQDHAQVVDIDQRQIGWHTNRATKPKMCGALRHALADKCEGVWDVNFYSECTTFITHPKTGNPGAESGNHDDRVIAQSIKWMLHEWLPAPYEHKTVHDPHAGKDPFGVKISDREDIRTIWR